jgi:hypothetical protein
MRIHVACRRRAGQPETLYALSEIELKAALADEYNPFTFMELQLVDSSSGANIALCLRNVGSKLWVVDGTGLNRPHHTERWFFPVKNVEALLLLSAKKGAHRNALSKEASNRCAAALTPLLKSDHEHAIDVIETLDIPFANRGFLRALVLKLTDIVGVTPDDVVEEKKNVASKKKTILDVEEAPLEAFAPEIIPAETSVPGHIIHGCDGEDAYLWWVRPNKKGNGLRVTEVAPGLDKKNTRLRRIEDASDLTYSVKKTLEQLMAGWSKKLVGDLEPFEEKAAKKALVNTRVVETLDDESNDGDFDQDDVENDEEDVW